VILLQKEYRILCFFCFFSFFHLFLFFSLKRQTWDFVRIHLTDFVLEDFVQGDFVRIPNIIYLWFNLIFFNCMLDSTVNNIGNCLVPRPRSRTLLPRSWPRSRKLLSRSWPRSRTLLPRSWTRSRHLVPWSQHWT